MMRNGFELGNGRWLLSAILVLLGLLAYPAVFAGTLNIARLGSGFGVVSSDAGVINCGSACTDSYAPGTSVNLTATPEVPVSGSAFRTWMGDCAGSSPNCTVNINDFSFIAIAVAGYGTGDGHTVALKSDGSVWAWGDNSDGQLGDGTTIPRYTHVPVSGLNNVSAIATGPSHSAALKNDGTVWTWGYNSHGELGDGTTTNRLTPVLVSGLNNVTAIIAGEGHTVALKSDGTVWTWGYNPYGQLGDGTTTSRSTPVPVSGLNNVTAIAAGSFHTVALKSDGTAWAWGSNFGGWLGDGTTTQRLIPVLVSGLNNVTAIAAGGFHTMALKNDGTFWAWGDNSDGQLGDGTTTDRLTPVQVTGLSNISAITAGQYHSAALKSDGTVWTWGSNFDGQQGNGTYNDNLIPASVNGLSGVSTIAVGLSSGHIVVLKSDGTVWGWGGNVRGQVLVDGPYDYLLAPVQVIGKTQTVTAYFAGAAIAGGEDHTVGLRSDGTAWAWGTNTYGQLGNGTTTDSAIPMSVSGLSGVIAIAGGFSYTVALKDDGTVWAWGYNFYGQLGDGTNTNRSTPAPVSGLSGIIAVAAGESHAVALKSDGTVWAWGYNFDGQLGDGSTTDRWTPVSVSSLNGIIAIAAGDEHSVALKNNGTVWTWGSNLGGGLGDGTNTNCSTPIPVSGLSGIIAVAAGGYFNVALQGDGSVWAWGDNTNGQLGDGTTIDRWTPVSISGLSGVNAITTGGNHTLVLKSDGTVLAWGDNRYGQLGDGTTIWPRITPIQVTGMDSVIAVVSGGGQGSHTIALKNDGTVWAWGLNTGGQLGDNSTANSSLPVQTHGAGNVGFLNLFFYNVMPSAGANGSISPSTPQSISYRQSAAFTVTPAPGYTAMVTGCGGNLTGNLYLTGPITSDCAISARFIDTATALVVTKLADTNDGSCAVDDCSLREAVAAANALPADPDLITFKPGLTGTITLSTGPGFGELAITDDVLIHGPGPATLAVSGNNASRIFTITNAAAVMIDGLTFERAAEGAIFSDYDSLLTLNHCRLTDNFHQYRPGGAIDNRGTLTVSQCELTNNRTTLNLANNFGGAIYNDGTLNILDSTLSGNIAGEFFRDYGGAIFNAGTLNIMRSTLSGNSALGGGGIFSPSWYGPVSVTLIDSTVSGNTAESSGGGIYSQGHLTLISSTVSGNTATAIAGDNGYGGGIFNEIGGLTTVINSTITGNTAIFGGGIKSEGPLSIGNSLIAGNTATYNGQQIWVEVSNWQSQGHNLIGQDNDAGMGDGVTLAKPTAPDFTPGAGIQIADIINPTLTNNGGPTQTHLLVASGPAIDAGSNALIPGDITTDQRGEARIQNGVVDVGAVEGSSAALTPTLSINNVSQTEGNSGNTPFIFTVTLSAAASLPVTVNWATADGTATSGSDYTAASGSLTFAVGGSLTQTITVQVIGDATAEPNETFVVNLSAPVNATLAQAQGTGTILNDDSPTLSINNVSQNEGNAGSTPFVFTVTLSTAASLPVTVDWATADGTATAGSDYTTASGSLIFPVGGSLTQTLTVQATGDTLVEPNETFVVNLSAPINATLAQTQGTGTLVNDDVVTGLYSVVWSGDQFVAVGSGGEIQTSPDGATWTPQTSGTTQNLSGIAWSGQQFVAVGSGGVILTSLDGSAWTLENSGTTKDLNGVVWSGSVFVAVGGDESTLLITSPNGVDWTDRTPTAELTDEGLVQVAWSGSQFVAVGGAGTVLASANGTVWTPRNSGTTEDLNGVVWSGQQFVAVGEGGAILTSPNGSVWTPRNTGRTDPLYDIAWSGQQFLAVGESGVILASPDGITWTPHASGIAESLLSVVWSGNQWMAVGANGAVLAIPRTWGDVKPLTGQAWTLIGLPAESTLSDSVDSLFGDNLGSYGTDWVVWQRNAADQYVALAKTDRLTPGIGYWIQSASANPAALTLDQRHPATRVTTSNPHCLSRTGCYEITLTAPASSDAYRYQLIGMPFPYLVSWWEARLEVDGIAYPLDSRENEYVAPTYWVWDRSDYAVYDGATPGMTGLLQPWQGLWIKVYAASRDHTLNLLIPRIPR